MYERRTTFCQTSLLPCRSILRVFRASPRPFDSRRFLVVFPLIPPPPPPSSERARPALASALFYFSRFQSTQTGFKIPPAEKSECHLSPFHSYPASRLLLSLFLFSLPPFLPSSSFSSSVRLHCVERSSYRSAFRRSPSHLFSLLSFLSSCKCSTLFRKVLKYMNEECRATIIFVRAMLKSCGKLKNYLLAHLKKTASTLSPRVHYKFRLIEIPSTFFLSNTSFYSCITYRYSLLFILIFIRTNLLSKDMAHNVINIFFNTCLIFSLQRVIYIKISLYTHS